MPSFSTSALFPHLVQLGSYLKQAADHYADVRSAGRDLGPEALALWVEGKMATWDPVVGTRHLLDDETRRAGARLISGLVCNLTGTL